MNYNQFTIDYIKAVQNNLCIEINSNNEAVFFPEKIDSFKIKNLKKDLSEIFTASESSIEILKNKTESSLQAGLFGLVNNLDKAVKVGFLIADRIVLIDYIFERILSKKFENINKEHLGALASSLVQLLPLAKKGRIVIIQNPFSWFDNSKKIIVDLANKNIIDTKLMIMLNMLSITKECNIHPYTIAESEEEYKLIINEQIDNVDVIGRNSGTYAFEGILASLLSEKLLDNAEFKIAMNLPIDNYFEIISSNKDFYHKYLSQITSGGSLNSDNNIEQIRADLAKEIKDRNTKLPQKLKKVVTNVGAIGGGTIALLGTISVISAPVSIGGALLSLSPALFDLFKTKSKNEDPIISVFSKLIE